LCSATFQFASTRLWERLKAKLYNKHDNFTFPIVNFFISSYIPASPPYGVYISQLVHYSRACAQYSDLLDRVQMLTQKLLKLSWNHCYKNCTVVITIWLTLTKYSYLKWQWIFYFLRRILSFLYHCQGFDRTWLYIWVTRQVSYKKQDLLTLREYLSPPLVFWWGPCCPSFQFSVLCLCSVSCTQCCLCLLSLPSSFKY